MDELTAELLPSCGTCREAGSTHYSRSATAYFKLAVYIISRDHIHTTLNHER